MSGGGRTSSLLIEGRQGPDNASRSEGGGQDENTYSVNTNVVTMKYFSTMGIRLLAGRAFEERSAQYRALQVRLLQILASSAAVLCAVPDVKAEEPDLDRLVSERQQLKAAAEKAEAAGLEVPGDAAAGDYAGSIAIDVGDQDGLRADTVKLHEALETYDIAHGFEVYAGTHTSRVADRFQNHVLPFFGRNLCFEARCQ